MYSTEVETETNFQIFLNLVQPKPTTNCTKHKNCYEMNNLFNFFDLPYGIEIPLKFENDKIQKTYFVPCLSAIQIYDEKSNIILEYFEKLRPDLRIPFNETIELIFEKQKDLLQEHSSNYNEKSWYSVNWNPILFENGTSHEIKGQILTYHKITTNSMICCYPHIFKKKFWFKENGSKKMKEQFQNCQNFLNELKVEHPDLIHLKK